MVGGLRVLGLWLMLGLLAHVAAAQGSTPLAEALRTLDTLAPDPCEANGAEDFGRHPEAPVFAAASALVLERLNGVSGTAIERARGAIAEATREGVQTQAGWPEDSRFRGEATLAGPAVVVTMFVRTRGRWFAFGEVNGRWKVVGEDEGALDDSPRRLMKAYRLRAARAGVARFLAARTFFGCAGSSAISYQVMEWDPAERGGYVAQALKQEGALGMDEAADGRGPSAQEPFWPVGRLVTDGPVLELPYCLFTGLDTWDNPSLCALDRYDLRGSSLRFVSRSYNRPELVPVAKAMEYAGKHDLAATRAYCASDKLARRLVFDGAPGTDASVEVVRHGRGKRVWLGDRESWLDVEMRGGRWVIVGMGAGSGG